MPKTDTEVNAEDAGEDEPVLGSGPVPSPTVEELEEGGRLASDVNASSSVQDEEVGEFEDDKIADYQKGLAADLRTVYPTGYEQPELVLTEDPEVVSASARSGGDPSSSPTTRASKAKDDS